MVAFQSAVLVEINGKGRRKICFSGGEVRSEFIVDAQGGRACGKAEDACGFFLKLRGENVGCENACVLVAAEV